MHSGVWMVQWELQMPRPLSELEGFAKMPNKGLIYDMCQLLSFPQHVFLQMKNWDSKGIGQCLVDLNFWIVKLLDCEILLRGLMSVIPADQGVARLNLLEISMGLYS